VGSSKLDVNKPPLQVNDLYYPNKYANELDCQNKYANEPINMLITLIALTNM
jgi:hypothetical protein